jgi:hypothetical protein
MGTLQVGGTTLGVKNTSTNKVDLSNAGDVNISGDITKDSLPMYACRAWVNFDGTKDTSGATSADTTNRLIRGSGNVASVLRPDANYCISGAGGRDSTGGGERYVSIGYLTTTSFRYWTHVDSTQAIDAENVCASVFR